MNTIDKKYQDLLQDIGIQMISVLKTTNHIQQLKHL